MKSGLPEDWVRCTLDDVARWGTGGTPSRKNKEYYDGDIPWVKTGDLGPRILEKHQEFISELGLQNSNAKVFPKGSVALAMYGATIGKTSIFGIDTTTNQACAVGIPTKATSTEFLYYALLNEKEAFISKSFGGAQPNISQSIIREHEISLPPLAEQKVIADKLDTLLAQVESTQSRLERIPDILKRFRQSVLSSAVSGKLTEDWRKENGDIRLTPEIYKNRLGSFKTKSKSLPPVSSNGSWLSCNLGHFITVKSGQGLTSRQMNHEGSIPVYGGNGITGVHDEFNFEETRLILGRVGYYCGSVHLTEAKSWITDNALIVESPEELIDLKFSYWLLNGTNLRGNIASSAQPVISGSKIYPIDIQLPPLPEQHEIVRRVETLFAYADRIETQAKAALERVSHLTQSILAKAFRGELTAEWRAANPDLISGENSAEALLEKIQVERTSESPAKRRNNKDKK